MCGLVEYVLFIAQSWTPEQRELVRRPPPIIGCRAAVGYEHARLDSSIHRLAINRARAARAVANGCKCALCSSTRSEEPR